MSNILRSTVFHAVLIEDFTTYISALIQMHFCFCSKECPSLLKSLNDGNFDELKQHLEGLQMLYSIEGDR